MTSQKDVDSMVWNAFLHSSWGKTVENDQELRAIKKDYLDNRDGDIATRVINAIEDGKSAFERTKELAEIFNKNGQSDAELWLENETNKALSRRIQKTLRHKLKKLISYNEKQMRRHAKGQKTSKVKARLISGEHPNSLRRQDPSSSWDIYIDETGTVFDDSATGLRPFDRKVGRVVALAVPTETQLPHLGKFHATDVTFQEIDEVIQQLLDSKVGIFGFSVQDYSSRHSDWLGHILHLVRWTLLQLPTPTDATSCRVRVFIEQRGSYSPDLSNNSWEIESEFRALDPKRYSNLDLSLEFMGKNNPMNGYVDAIANTWGGTAVATRDRLEKSLLRGHCLIETESTSLHHLYLALRDRHILEAREWYDLCSIASNDPADGFLARSLGQLGQELQSHPTQWKHYIEEVQARLRSKQYRLDELSHAIAWLEQYASQDQTIPDILKLQLASSKLAFGNHSGQLNMELFEECLTWAERFHDEEPQLACETVLRMASTSTNFFEFGLMEKMVLKWLDEPVAVASLRNYGKLQSTFGQLIAFQGQNERALDYFSWAIDTFSRLSDGNEANREIRQTRHYRLIAEFELALGRAEKQTYARTPMELLSALAGHFGGDQSVHISRTLSQGSHFDRYDQHLWLRALVSFPDELASARKEYILNRSNWGTGTDHPWGLILAYRAWLLHDFGEQELARKVLNDAIASCAAEDHGPTLDWIAEVLRTLGQALNIEEANELPSDEQRKRLMKRIRYAPHASLKGFAEESFSKTLEREKILEHLEACLPFSFH